MFGPIDGVVLVLFLGAIFALGFSARVLNHNILQYLAAGRNLTLPMGVATLVCTWYGGILGIGESVAYFGIGTWLLFGVPYYVFAFIYAQTMSRRVRRAEALSIPEQFQAKFGPGAGRFAAGLLFLLAIPAAHVLMLGILVQSFLPVPLPVAVMLGATFGSLFLFRGGLMADVRASSLAFVMMYVGFAVMVVHGFSTTAPAELWSTLQAKNLASFTGNTSFPTIVSFFILGAWTLVDPGFHQRVSAMSEPETSRKMVLVSIGFWALFDLLSISTALLALAQFTAPPDPLLQIFPTYALRALPDGLRAVFFCGMLGTILSAMVGYALVGGSTLGRDLLAPLLGKTEPRTVLRLTKWGIAFGISAACALALSIQSVVALWYSWGGIVVGALLWPVLNVFAFSRDRPLPGVMLSMIGGFVAGLALLIYGLLHQNPSLIFPLAGLGDVSVGTLLPSLAVSGVILLAHRPFRAQEPQP